MEKGNFKLKKPLVIGIVVAVLVVALGAFSVVVVPAGHTGVVVNLGSVQEGCLLYTSDAADD